MGLGGGGGGAATLTTTFSVKVTPPRAVAVAVYVVVAAGNTVTEPLGSLPLTSPIPLSSERAVMFSEVHFKVALSPG